VSVQRAWADIVQWCRRNAPATAAAIRPPADTAMLRQAVAATSGRWPDDLGTWYQLADGTERTPHGYLLPSYCPMPLQNVIEHWRMWLDVGRDLRALRRAEDEDPWKQAADRSLGVVPEGHDEVFARLQTEPAGTAAGMFLPSFVPIAEDQSGSDLFVDTRHGESHGCVARYDNVDVDYQGRQWPSVTAMLTDVADALRTASPVGYWQPEVEDGTLSWRIV
jgi:cell wall assembly regulator SMI1